MPASSQNGQIKGLDGFRNILVHRYLGINPDEVFDNFQKGLVVFPAFAQEILAWLDAQVGEGSEV